MADKYFKDSSGKLHQIDENFTSLLPPDCEEIEESEYEDLVVKNNTPSGAQLWADYRAKAQAALDKTDLICLRCYKAGVAYPAEWLDYTNELRAIIRATSGDSTSGLPVAPNYPSGT